VTLEAGRPLLLLLLLLWLLLMLVPLGEITPQVVVVAVGPED
jgi:hypothetical protein